MTAAQNDLIALLPRRDQDRLKTQCEAVDLVLADVICEPGEALTHVHFPVDGFISLLSVNDASLPLEVGMVGREGMLGMHLVLGVTDAPLRALVQGAGLSLRIGAAAFRHQLKLSPALQRVLLRYVHVCSQQLATSAVCLRFHQLSPRLARWLLMTQDRAHSDQFHVTQDFLSSMLGMRRVGVTAAALSLQNLGLITYRRGAMQVLDRPGLEAVACSCYGNDRRTYQKALG